MIDLTLAAKGEAEAAPAPASLMARAGGWFGVLTALLLYLVTRLGQLAAIDWMTPAGGPSVRDHLLIWDAGWFVRVATEGYAHSYSYGESGEMVGNGLAFFPLYPLLIRAGAATGLSPQTAALVVTWLAGAAAAVLLHLLGTSLYSRRVGFALVVLACAQPMSVVLSMAYSEGLFLALVAGMLLAAHRRAWLAAGALGLAAALTRPTGVAAAVALTVAALTALRGLERRERWRALVASAVALAGAPAYLLWVALRVGDWDAWFNIQTAGWGSSFDYGSSVVRFAVDSLRAGADWVPLSIVWILAAAVVAAVMAVTQRVWAPLTVYGLLVLVLVLGQAGYYHSKPRLLVPVLLILVPAAVALGRARPRTAVPVLAGYAAFGIWYGAHMVAVWPYAI
jgi:Mannosyltransferase (PIG-V)